MVLGGQFSCGVCYVCVHSFSLAFSLTTLSTIRATSPLQCPQLFSSTNQLFTVPTFHRSFLRFVDMQLCFLRLLRDFLGVRNDLVFIQLCLREEANLGSLLLHHLNPFI